MNYTEDIKPISFIKSNSAQMLEQINETKRPIIITQNGHARGVLVDPESYNNILTTIELLQKISRSEQDIKEGRTTESSEVFKKLYKKLQAKDAQS